MEVQSRLPLYRKEALFVSYVVPLQLRTEKFQVQVIIIVVFYGWRSNRTLNILHNFSNRMKI